MARILIVEDSPLQAAMLRRLLQEDGHAVRHARHGVEGLAMAQAERPELVISDVTMPEMDGFEMCRRLRDDAALAGLPIILLTAMNDVRDVLRGLDAGADNYVTKPYDRELLRDRVRAVLASPPPADLQPPMALHALIDGRNMTVHARPQQVLNLLLSTYTNALAQNSQLQSTQDALTALNEQLQQEVARQSSALLAQERHLAQEREALLRQETEHLQALQGTLLESVAAIAATVEMRDPYTSGHQRRVADLAVLIGRELGMDAHRLEGLQIAGVVHDVGKIRIPAEILTKPGKLEAVEYAFIKTHARTGYDILKHLHFPWPIADMVVQHHERLDGSGYPQGLKGEAILLEARILAVADVVESMATSRPYRKAVGVEAAIAEIDSGRGTRYDTAVVDAFTALHQRGAWAPEVA